jgi:hypothetical protein
MDLQKLTLLISSLLILFSCNSPKNIQKDDPFLNFSANDTSAIYEWSGPCCLTRGIYNPQKYSLKQLQSTYELVLPSISFNSAFIYKPSDIAALSIEALDNEYSRVIDYYNELEVVPENYWLRLKEDRIREIKEEYELTRIKYIAFNDSSILENNRFSEHCKSFVNALTSSDTSILLNEWKSFIESKRETNANPNYMNEFYSKFNSNEKLLYAKIELLTYGWNNCANDLVFRIVEDEKASSEFDKLFKETEQDCEDCD